MTDRNSTPAALAAKRRYNASAKGRASRKRYAATEAGREAQRRSKEKWNRENAALVRAASYERKRKQSDRINAIKLASGCADCGYSTHPAALDFDHVGDGKTANVSSLIGCAWDRVAAEIAKCEVVCANCHRIRTVGRLA